jgi:hypothetical protein
MKSMMMDEKVDGLLHRYPGKIPVIINDKNNIFHKTKFLIPESYTVGMLMAVLRNYTEVKKYQALFLFFDGVLPSSNSTIGELFIKYRNENILECVVTLENTFG